MTLFTTSSGLAGLAGDLREFLAALRFARAEWLWLILLLPLLGMVNRWSTRQRRAAIARVGRPAAVAGQLTHLVARRRWLGLAYPLAWIALILGLAGRAGQERRNRHRGRPRSRDRHRLKPQHAAPDMADANAITRWQAARRRARPLERRHARGGHRVAVVVFARIRKSSARSRPITTTFAR